MRYLTIFIAAPRVNKFEFPSDAKENDRISVMCSLRGGSTPLKFEWLRNGVPIDKSERLNIGITDETSTLTLKHLKAEDVANYTCIAKNREGMDAFTATLRMRSKCHRCH